MSEANVPARVYCGARGCTQYVTPDLRHLDNLAGRWRCHQHRPTRRPTANLEEPT